MHWLKTLCTCTHNTLNRAWTIIHDYQTEMRRENITMLQAMDFKSSMLFLGDEGDKHMNSQNFYGK